MGTPTLEPAPQGGKNTKGSLAAKAEAAELLAQDHLSDREQTPDAFAGTWITTTPLGIQIGTKGSERLDLKPLLAYQATDPVNGTVMITREDRVVVVEKKDGYRIVDHADGTRITTFFQDCVELVPNDNEETDTNPQTIRRKVKCARVENPDFATVITNCEDSTCCAIFADGTSIISKPQGTYQILPINKGCLFIDENCSAVYSPEAFDKSDCDLTFNAEDQQIGKYIMKHNSSIACEVMEPEGNIFKVMADGSTFVFIANIDSDIKELEPTEIKTPVIYGEHAPRFFIVYADGSGTELLRTRETEEYLAMAYGDPVTAVLQEPIQECPGVLSITILHPLTEVSQWVMKRDSATIIPGNLQSRAWENFPPVERRIPGPPFGMHAWKGLNIEFKKLAGSSPPIEKCPNVLQVRRLIQYEPVSDELRHKLQLSVKIPQTSLIVSDLVLKTPRMLVLGDFNFHAKTVLTGAAQDFMASMTAMGLSQHVIGPTHERGHTLDLVFSMGQEEGDLRVRNLSLTPLSWSDHFLIRFELESGLSLCKGADPIVLVCPRSRMDPDGFLEALGDFPVGKAGDPVDALVELWNEEMTRAIDTIAPKRPLPPGRAHSSPWYTPELRAMKQVGRCLECRWRRLQGDSDRTHLRAHYRAYAVAVRMARKKFFSISIASSQCRAAELFWVVQGLLPPGPKRDLVPPSKARCDNFAKHFREKITQIRHKLDSAIESDFTGELPSTPSSPQLMDEFQLLRPDDVDKVLGQVCPTICLLDPCPSWLLKKAKDGIGTWILEVVNASLRDGWVPAPLKEAVVRPVLKKASLDPEVAANYRPVANIRFLGKVLEQVVVGPLQALLDETDYLDPFQSGFRPGYGTESALVALYDDLCRERDRGSASLLVLLDLSAAFDTINHGILLNRLVGLGVGGTVWRWFRSYLNGRFQKVVLGDYGSAPWQLCHGVLQGSILSPLLFNIYMKPLGEVIRRCGLWNHQYADDTQLYLSFSTNPGEAVAVLNWCLVEVMGWMKANKLKLNPDKTEVL
ncbi:Sperm-associated antigen 17 [Varanus komodoensis]|nr:Sperm-associated antigen 17 [Varanus komodoensis]